MNTPIPANKLKMLVNISMLIRVLYKEDYYHGKKELLPRLVIRWVNIGFIEYKLIK